MVYPKIRQAVKSAFSGLKPPDTAGLDQQKKLNTYNQLKPHDFASLIEKHGEGMVLQYIKDMEALRSTNDNSGRTSGT